ncbi:MAG TPA: hypothetical protein VFA34_06260 [Actinomycetota bacterium]|nr:hypothetical protein [Actinomycetota bacterium]
MKWLLTLLVGIVIGALGFAVLRPASETASTFGPQAVWAYSEEGDRLIDCGNVGEEGETRCALNVMDEAGASESARSFFRQTHWFLQAFRETGVVDIGAVVTPWRANANDDYLLLNGSPSVVSVEREAPPVALFGQDPAYEPLRTAVNAKDDVPEEDDLVLWETDEVFERVDRKQGKIRFVFQWSLKDGCHACDTGYRARVALEFGGDGTYLGAEPLDICWSGGGDAERVEDEAPSCPRTTKL